MTKRMLVDATHAEEVRVAVVQDQRLIDLDIETASREQIKGNIYLARVSRVEPALQAAFVEFHDGRQGFLPGNDIHSKYYPSEEPPREGKNVVSEGAEVAGVARKAATSQSHEPDPGGGLPLHGEEDGLNTDELPPVEELRTRPRRRYLPIQRILSRGQTILVQVAKEARGTKGAALTTNISLAGRYTVLLPENSGGGGISRKITDPAERKHLKIMIASMGIPDHISLIVRTAGLGRTKREIARDMSYLMRLWKMIQDKTSVAKPPALLYEEGDLIIRTIRDLYTTDMEEILIEGHDGYRVGKDFMRLLMPRYVKVVQPYKDSVPLFARYQIESQIESMHERMVSLRAGGYLVIDATEALVSIDINSGRSMRERDVEMTAYKTNIQAAEEIGRQLRLRDLSGLIVIDFIDMGDKKHNLEVERRLKEALKIDRAKIQIGKISQFGLLELSRQRMKPTFSETNRLECPRCKGSGTIRSVDSAAVHLFRQLEEEVAKGLYSRLVYTTSQEVANYLLNQKRDHIQLLEKEYDTEVVVYGDASVQTPEFHKNRTERPPQAPQIAEVCPSEDAVITESVSSASSNDGVGGGAGSVPAPEDDKGGSDDRKRSSARNRRGKRKKDKKDKITPPDVAIQKEGDVAEATPQQHDATPAATAPLSPPPSEGDVESVEKTRRRRRRRRKSGNISATSAVLTEVAPIEHRSDEVDTGEVLPDAADIVSMVGPEQPLRAPSVVQERAGVISEAVATPVPGLYVMAQDGVLDRGTKGDQPPAVAMEAPELASMPPLASDVPVEEAPVEVEEAPVEETSKPTPVAPVEEVLEEAPEPASDLPPASDLLDKTTPAVPACTDMSVPQEEEIVVGGPVEAGATSTSEPPGISPAATPPKQRQRRKKPLSSADQSGEEVPQEAAHATESAVARDATDDAAVVVEATPTEVRVHKRTRVAPRTRVSRKPKVTTEKTEEKRKVASQRRVKQVEKGAIVGAAQAVAEGSTGDKRRVDNVDLGD